MPTAPRALLVYTSGPELADDYFARKIPVGLGILNAVLNQAGFGSQVGNFSRFTRERMVETLRREKPQVLGLSVFTFNRHPSVEVAAIAKELDPACYVVAGGPHVTHLDRDWLEAYPQFDAIVRGEGEDTMLELMRMLAAGDDPAGIAGLTARDRAGRIVFAGPRPAIDDLDRLPHNAAHLSRSIGIDVPDQLRYLITSRGCPGACTFCNTPDFWGRKVRFRSAADVMAELETMRERHGLVHVSIRDDTFTAHRPRTIEICQRLIDSGRYWLWDCQSRVNLVDQERLEWMKRAGCHHIQYGVESGSDGILKILQKDISAQQIRDAVAMSRDAGLVVSIYLIAGVPEETDEDIQATIALVRDILPHDGIVAPLAFFPGTRLYDQSKGYLSVDDSIWVKDPRAAIYVREDPEAARHFEELLVALHETGVRAAYGPTDFDRFDQRFGFVFTTALQRSEWHRSRGDYDGAFAAATSIVEREPKNPWGHLRLADLHTEVGDDRAAAASRRRAKAIVPRLAL